MLFNSYIFILAFLPLVWGIYFGLNYYQLTKVSKVWLVMSSLFFYSWWNISYLPLIIASVLFNYLLTSKIVSITVDTNNFLTKKKLLVVGLVFNIGFLFYFKYMDFFIENFNFTIGTDFSLLHLALPLGISFFTLQQIAFIVDSYQGLVKEKNFLDYSLFVTFFPQLIAGPIVHHKDMMPQFALLKNKNLDYHHILSGIFLFSIGLFKKVMIADQFGIYATQGFDIQETLTMMDAWVTSLSYSFQLYFDFSAYSDMAIGAALLFNIKLPQNFNSPMKATGMIDYWKRWHMTLTNFITSYIYTPIVRSFKTVTFNKAMFATLIVFLISGMWHGAGWTFIFWGLLHGSSVIVNHYWQKKIKIKMPWVLAWFITFQFVNISNIFFRAKSFEDALKVLDSMFSLDMLVLPKSIEMVFGSLATIDVKFGHVITLGYSYTYLWILMGFVIVLGFKNSMEQLKTFQPNYQTAILSGLAFIISVLSMDKISEFLYFNF